MSDIIYTPPASGGGGTTINPTNDFIPVRSNATTFIDSVLFNDANILQTNNNFGFYCSFTNRVFSIGDFNEGNNATYLSINDNNQLIKTINQANDIGLKLDFASEVYSLGDYNNVANKTLLNIDDANKYVFLGNINADSGGFRYSYLGNGSTNNFYLEAGCNPDGVGLIINHDNINPTNSYLYLSSNYNLEILSGLNGTLNLRSNVIGVINEILLDPTSDKQTFTTGALNFVGATLQSNSASGSSGRHLVITLNGTQYKIALLNP